MADNVIKTKNSSTPGAVPVSLEEGELALNSADGKIFYRDPAGNVQELQVQPRGDRLATGDGCGYLLDENDNFLTW